MSIKNPWKTLRVDAKYANPWLQVDEHQVLRPSGEPGIYGVVHFKNLAIGILPVSDEGDTWLVGQFRYPLQKYSWEIPEGGGGLSLSPLESAKRELKEETGISARDWQLILEMDLSNSATDERSYSYLARGLTLGEAEPDDDEVLELKRIPLKKVVEMVMEGEIRDALAVATILKAARVLGI